MDIGRRFYMDSYLHVGDMDSVLNDATSSDIIDLSGANAFDGVIRGIKCSCDSTNYDIYIFTKAQISFDSIYEVVKLTGINKSTVVDDLYVMFKNRDDTSQKRLYFVIYNHDVTETGNILYEVSFSLHRTKDSPGEM